MGGTDENYQTFRPSKNTLDKVAVEVFNATPSKDKIEFKIKKWNGSGWDLVKQSKQLSLVEGWNEYDFGDVAVTTGGRYAIFVNIFTDALVGWKYSSNGTYANGYAFAQGTDQPNWDTNFKTWGYDSSTPPPPANSSTDSPADNGSSTNQGTQQSASGISPTSNTSSSIQKPTNLSASNESSGGVKLSWATSTTSDIDGYLVFVSETQGKNYKLIGQTSKDVVEYLDKAAVSGKTYYYIVRAYKDSAQSESSNEVNITAATPKDESSKNNVNTQSSSDNKFFTPIMIIGLGLVAILSAILGYLIYKRKKITKGKKASSSSNVQFGDSQSGRRLESGVSNVRSKKDKAGSSGSSDD